MISFKNLTKHTALALIIICSLFLNKLAAQDGKALFMQHCASCHAASMWKESTGPALGGVEGRWESKELLHKWIKNSAAVIASGDPYANEIFKKYNGQAMTKFEGTINDKEIDAILAFIASVPKPVEGAPSPGKDPAGNESDSSLVFGILTLILAVVAFVLLQVNSNLKKLADDKDGIPAHEPVPFWRNRAYITILTIIAFLIGGFYVVKGAIGLGRTKDYQPEQPIFYSHKVHAGTNQISCLYCHGNTEDGKQANIPSLNVCMNCHMNITEYTGEPLKDSEGNEIDGTAEIAKLHKAVGFAKGQTANNWSMDTTMKYPIEWVKIHSLPDHVYFNHSQHVKAGKVQCQTCHGEIQNMDEVKQFAELSMGWCINCHRETKVQFKENGFYTMYEKYHNDLKSGKIDSTKGVTAEMIGATECQKCHY